MRAYRLRLLTLLLLALVGSLPSGARRAVAAGTAGPTLPHPLLFVTQVPIPDDFTTIGSVFGNHLATMQSAGRGGDLWIRYPDGTLKPYGSRCGVNGHNRDAAARAPGLSGCRVDLGDGKSRFGDCLCVYPFIPPVLPTA